MNDVEIKVGDIVKIVGNTTAHNFPIGERVRIVRIIEGGNIRAEYLDGHDFWWVRSQDIEIVDSNQQPEQVKEEDNMIGKITGADWSKAPESATHVNKSRKGNFYSKGDRGWLGYFDESPSTFPSGDFLDKDSLTGRGDYLLVSKEEDLGITQSNTEPKSEWKIRHIKSDDYKSGRDIAITILYKEIGNGYYEYKFAICSPNDMFSRKKGVEEALKKEGDKLYNEGSVPFTGLVLMHMSVSNKFSKSTRSLILSKMAELV